MIDKERLDMSKGEWSHESKKRLVEQFERANELEKEKEDYQEFYKLAENHLGEDDFYMLIEKWNEGDSNE